jgi:PAS domain S-box-containing protein
MQLASTGTLITQLVDTLLIIERDGTIRSADDGLSQLLGYDPADAPGREVWDFVHPDDMDNALRALERHLREPGLREPMLMIRCLHMDGTWRLCEVPARTINNEEGAGIAVGLRWVGHIEPASEVSVAFDNLSARAGFGSRYDCALAAGSATGAGPIGVADTVAGPQPTQGSGDPNPVAAPPATVNSAAHTAAASALTPIDVGFVTAVGSDGSATVAWGAPTNLTAAQIRSYTVTWSSGGPPLGSIEVTQPTTVVTALSNGTTYVFTVNATSVDGIAGPALTSAPVTPNGVPGAPSPFVSNITQTSVTVSWVPADPRGKPITDYVVSITPTGGWAHDTLVTTTTANITGLAPSTGYTVTVTSRNANGATPSTPISFATKAVPRSTAPTTTERPTPLPTCIPGRPCERVP